MTALIDFAGIRAANPLPDVATAVGMELTRCGCEWKGCCPFHSDRSPSFTIYADGTRFQCFGCGASGDVIDFVRLAKGCELADAARMLSTGDIPRVSAGGASSGYVRPPDTDTTAAALRIWRHTAKAAGTLAETYLRSRDLSSPYPADFRFHPALKATGAGPFPCLVAAVRDVAGQVAGIQRIFLAPDGLGKADMDKPKLSLGKVKGGAIRLGDLDGSGVVTVCEGPEDGLSLLAMLGGPVWIAAGATFLPAMQFPTGVHSIIIGADNDPAGQDSARKAAHAFTERGLSVRIIRPLDGFKDFNDELRGVRP